MEKEDLEIRKASEELTAEDLEKVTGGVRETVSKCPKECGCGCD